MTDGAPPDPKLTQTQTQPDAESEARAEEVAFRQRQPELARVHITGRRRTQEALAIELQAMTRLQKLSERLPSVEDLSAALGEVLETAITLHEADRGAVQVYDPSTDSLRYSATRGFDASVLSGIPPVDRNFHSTCATALRTGKPVIAANIPDDPRFADHRDTAAALDYQAAFSFPLTTHCGEFLGVLTVHFRNRREPTKRELRWAAFYAPLAAHLIEQRQADEALRDREERLRLAVTAGELGTWDWNVLTGRVVWNEAHFLMQGYTVGEVAPSYEAWMARVHPDDRAAAEAAMEAARSGHAPYRLQFRTVYPEGTIRWMSAQGSFFYDAAGAPVRMIGVMRDITDQRETEAALRRSEERLRLILESATDYAIFTLAPDRTVTSWSPGAAAVFGYAPHEIIGQSADVVFTTEDRAAGVPEEEAAQARRSGRAADERWHLRQDGTRFFASGVLQPLRDGGGFVKVARDLSHRKRIEDELRDAYDKLELRVAERTAELERTMEALEAEMGRRRALTQRLATAQEDERQRISRDLHDSIGQLMAGLSMAFRSIELSGELPAAAAARLAKAQELMSELGREVHGLAVRLRPTSLDDIGLESALGQLVAEWSSRSDVKVDLYAAGLGPQRLPAEVETTIYRVVQEALTNVAKHARATAVSVVVTHSHSMVSVAIEDNGTGFNPDSSLPAGRLGLLGMRERVELVGGTIDFESTPAAGTTVTVHIPTSRKPATT